MYKVLSSMIVKCVCFFVIIIIIIILRLWGGLKNQI